MKAYRLFLLGTAAGVVGMMAAPAQAGDVKREVTMYGFVNRMVSIQSDGNTVLFNHHDNDIEQSRFGVSATAEGANLTIQGLFEFAFFGNPSGSVNSGVTATTQRRNTAGSQSRDQVRQSDIIFTHKYGALYIGHGEGAADAAAESDLSGTGLIMHVGQPLSGGMGFSPQNTFAGGAGGNETSNAYTVSTVIPDLNGNGRTNRVKYETPTVGGVMLSVSNEHGGRMSAGAAYEAELGDFQVASKIGYSNNSSTNTGPEEYYGGSLSVLHSTGISGTYAYGITPNHTSYNAQPGNAGPGPSRGRPAIHYGKVGYQKDLFELGKTQFGVDYNISYDGVNDGDRGWKMGLGAVQNLDAYGAELYAAYEWIGFDRGDNVGDDETNPDSRRYHDIHAGYVGARVTW